jgi:hypothetical protein
MTSALSSMDLRQ